MERNLEEERRRVSQAAFGQRYRLELMSEILRSEDGIFTLTEMARAVGTSPSNLQGSIDKLLVLDLITRLPESETKSVHYMRNESAGWTWAIALEAQISYNLD